MLRKLESSCGTSKNVTLNEQYPRLCALIAEFPELCGDKREGGGVTEGPTAFPSTSSSEEEEEEERSHDASVVSSTGLEGEVFQVRHLLILRPRKMLARPFHSLPSEKSTE